jgi:hypothetical protein
VLGPVSGTVTITSLGAPSGQIVVSGTVTATPTVNPQAVFSGMSPSSGGSGPPILVTFRGSGFVPGALIGLTGVPNRKIAWIGPVTFVSSTELTALVKVMATDVPAPTYLYLNNPPPGGGSTSPVPYPGNVIFTANPSPPVITGFSPTIGQVGTAVTIRGYNLSLSNSSPSVYFNGIQTFLQPLSPGEEMVTFRVPTGATTGPIRLTNANGTFTTAVPFVVPPVFFEDFETGTKTSYIPASVPLLTMGWTLGEALIGTAAGVDKFNGTRAARLRGGGFIEMDVDKPNGAGVVTVSAATYATETGVSFVPEISTDGGVTYTSLLGSSAPPVLTGTLTPYSFTANRTGNVRLRFSSTNTAGATNPRLNLDDIGITDYRVGTAARPGQAVATWQVHPNPARGAVVVSGAGAGPATAALYDLLGRQVLAPQALAAGGALPLPAALPPGLYQLRLESAADHQTIRLEKE